MNDLGYNIDMRFSRRGQWQVNSGPRVAVIRREGSEYVVYKVLKGTRLIEADRRYTLDDAITLAVSLIEVKARSCYFLPQLETA